MYIADAEYETQNTQYTVIVNAPGSYGITVKAFKTQNGKKTYSTASNKVTYTLTATKLAAPEIEKSGNTVSWQAVSNADKYRVYVNEVSKGEISATSYTFAETTPGSYTVTVKAVSDSALYSASDDSNAVTFTVGQPVISGVMYITDAPFNAKADGTTNDREAIQSAIDAMNKNGGGTVVLPANKTVLTSNLILRDNVTLKFEDGAKLVQSADEDAYVQYKDGEYKKFEPVFGMDLTSDVEWHHAWTWNYPLILGPEGAKNIKITGKGTITMADHSVCYDTMHIAPIGFFNVDGFEISDITVDGYQSYAMMVTSSFNGLIKKVTIKNPRCSCNDGINMQNNQNIRVTECDVRSGDDALYVGAYYDDPRGRGQTWWNNDRTHVANKNLEFDNNVAVAGPNCKGFSFHFGGYMLDDPEEGEISDIYVHDNSFNTFGVWNHSPDPHAAYKPDKTLKPYQPFKTVRWENNRVDTNMGMGIPCSDMYDDTNTFKSMRSMINGDFEYARLGYWVSKQNSDAASVGAKKESNNTFGFIDKLDKGDAKLYQGLWLNGGDGYEFSAKVKTSGAACRLFVRDLLTGTLIASREFDNTQWQTVRMEFTAPASANYHIGIERGNAESGFAYIDDACLIAADSRNTIFTSEVPASSANDEECELGTVFTVNSSGVIDGVRMYVCQNESGVHTVRIWNKASGEVIAGPYDWSIPSGAARYETFALPTAVRVKSGTEYIVSVSTSADKLYAVTENGFDGFDAHSRYINVAENSGVKTTVTGGMPTDGGAACYFRDIVFTPDEQTVFGYDVPDDIDNMLGSELVGEIGMIFSADESGYVTRVKMLARNGLSGKSQVRIWKVDGAELKAGPYDWTHTGGAAGWKEFVLPEPFAVEKNVKYVMSVTQPGGSWYCSEAGVFSSEKTVGSLHTYVGSGVSSDAVGTMPANVWSNQSFFRDVVFVPASVADSLVENYIIELKTLYGEGKVSDNNAVELAKLSNIVLAMLDKLDPDALDLIPQADRDLPETVLAAVESFNARSTLMQTLLGETSATPDNYSYAGDGAREFGVKFSADAAGYVTKVKMYAHAELNVKAEVRIWKVDGAELIAGPYDWSISGGTAGWKTFVLPEPIELVPDEQYIVSVGQAAGLFGSTFHVFDAAATRRNLHTYVGSGVSSPALGTMPTNVYENQSFFRDIVFTPTTMTDELAVTYVTELKAAYGNGDVTSANADTLRNMSALLNGMLSLLTDTDAVSQEDRKFIAAVKQAVKEFDAAGRLDQSIFGYDVPDISGLVGDFASFETGVVFSADVDGYVTKVKFLSRGSLAGKKSTVSIWQTQSATFEGSAWNVVGGEKKATYEWTHTANEAGWVEFILPQPFAVIADVKYVLSITQPDGTWYCAKFNVFDAPITSGNLHTYTGSGVTGDMGAMPTNVYSNQSFFRDVVFTPTEFMDSLTKIYIDMLKSAYGDGTVNDGNIIELRGLLYAVESYMKVLTDAGAVSQEDRDLIAAVKQAVKEFDEAGKLDQTIFGYETDGFTPVGSETFSGELGTVFSADVDGYVTKVKFIAGAGMAGLKSVVKFWRVDGAVLLATYEWTHTATEAGWVEYTLPEPLTVEANAKYIVSITQEGWYKKQEGVHASEITSGNLHTYVGSGVSGNLGEMPLGVYNNQTFFRDIVFTPATFTASLVEKYAAEMKTIYGDGVTADNVKALRNLSALLTELVTKVDTGAVSQADKELITEVAQAISTYDQA